MDIYIHREHKPIGPFTEDQVREQLTSGKLKRTDHAWHEGLRKWQLVAKLVPYPGPAFPPPPKKHKFYEEFFESGLFNMRFLVLVAVLGSLAASITLFAKGSLEIIQGVVAFLRIMHNFIPNSADDKTVILAFIPAIDNYLFATVLLIFSMGIYELFVSKIDPTSRKPFSRPRWLNINSLDDLKTHISEVVIMILIINFFELSFSMKDLGQKSSDLLMLGGGIMLVAIALYVTHKIIIHRTEKAMRSHQPDAEHGLDASSD